MGIFKRRLKPLEAGMLYRQLAIMIGSGVPFSEAIQVLAEESESKSVKKMAETLSQDLKEEKTLKDSLKSYPEVFNDFVLFLLEKKDGGKKVSDAFHELADAAEDSGIIRSRFFQAVCIPVIELLVAFVLLASVLVFVIPVFDDMFSGMGSQLPRPTLIVVTASEWVRQYFLYLFILFIILVFIFFKSNKAVSALVTVIPGLNRIAKRLSLIHFTNHLRIMHAFGVPLREAVEKAASTVKHAGHAQKLFAAADRLNGDKQLEAALASTGMFTKSILRMIYYATRSESLSEVLERIAGYYRMDFDRMMPRIFQLIQIVAILIAAVVVGFIVISLYLPIFMMAGPI